MLSQVEVTELRGFLEDYDQRLSNDGAGDMYFSDTRPNREMVAAALSLESDEQITWEEMDNYLSRGKLLINNHTLFKYLRHQLEGVLGNGVQ